MPAAARREDNTEDFFEVSGVLCCDASIGM